MDETAIFSSKLQIERKHFIFELRENPRGRFVRITEEVSGRRDAIIVPAPGLEQFREALELVIRAHQSRAFASPLSG